MKKTFVNKKKLEEIIEQYPTPFHLYDEKGIRDNAREFKKAFSWNKGFKEYFAVKACPNPSILKILKEEGDTHTEDQSKTRNQNRSHSTRSRSLAKSRSTPWATALQGQLWH